MGIETSLQRAEDHLAGGRAREALSLFDDVLRELAKRDPRPDFEKGRISVRRSLAALRAGKATQAVEWLTDLHEYFSTLVGDDDEDSLRTLAALSEARQAAGDVDGALQDVRTLRDTTFVAALLDDSTRQDLLSEAAERLRALGQTAEADELGLPR
jgi:hypothetical protein